MTYITLLTYHSYQSMFTRSCLYPTCTRNKNRKQQINSVFHCSYFLHEQIQINCHFANTTLGGKADETDSHNRIPRQHSRVFVSPGSHRSVQLGIKPIAITREQSQWSTRTYRRWAHIIHQKLSKIRYYRIKVLTSLY